MEYDVFREHLNALIANENHAEIMSISKMPSLNEDEIKKNMVVEAILKVKKTANVSSLLFGTKLPNFIDVDEEPDNSAAVGGIQANLAGA